jgi:AraC family transcriptional regulator
LNYYLDRIQRGIDYIESRLEEELALCDVAKAAAISQWHFQRMFRALTGETLKTYVRSRRLANSLERLLTTELRVLDIALLAGFESQESFARAFKQAFGLTPQEYRRLGDKSLFLKKVQFNEEYLRHINRNVSLAPEIEEQPRRLFVGMRTLFFSVDSEKNNIGEKLPPLWQAFLPRLSEIARAVPGCCYGVVRQDQADSERLEYHAAIEVTDAGAVPAGMVSIELSPARYAKFAHRGQAERIDHTVNYVYSTWLAQSGYRHTYEADLEIYGAEYHPTDERSVIYYAVPIATNPER